MTEVLSILGENNEEVQFQKWRDLLKSAVIKLAGNTCIVLVGVESQSDIQHEKEMERLLEINERYSRMDNESVAAINTFTGVGISVDMEKEETDMCKAWVDHKEAGRKEGSEKERMTAIQNMIDLGISEEKILTKYSFEDYERARSSQLVT